MSSSLVIYPIPGTRCQAWIDQVRQVASRAGISFLEQWDEQCLETQGIIVRWISQPPSAVETAIILSAAPEDAIVGTVSLFGLSEAEATRHCSKRFAFASDLVRLGARVADQAQTEITFPLIGSAALPETTSGKVSSPTVQAIQFYDSLIEPKVRQGIWSPSLFFESDSQASDFPDQIDLTGRARLLFFGPFIALPRGRWEICVEFECDNDSTNLYLDFEWGFGTEFTTQKVEITEPGLYRSRIGHEWTAAADAQFRVALGRATFSGTFSLVRAICTSV